MNTLIGRSNEQAYLRHISEANTEARIVIVHGRRRVGKTTLIEHTFAERKLLKFEGLEGFDEAYQRQHILEELSEHTGNSLFKKYRANNWIEAFKTINEVTQTGEWTIYFEELQWLAHYKTHFVSELKYAWDNFFKNNPKLIIILCGSSPSFMIEKVIKSKALYNRSQFELPLKPFSIEEAQEFLPGKSDREVMDAYLLVGGIPEYLKRLKQKSSVLLSVANDSFTAGGMFTHEYERIFTSSLANNAHYQTIVDFVSHKKFTTRPEIVKHLKLKSGSMITNLLMDLEESGIIQSYTPYDLSEDSRLKRYQISDAYLQFYFKFIKPKIKDIDSGIFKDNPLSAINMNSLQTWLGFSFERFCRNNHDRIASILGFRAVQYKTGAYYNKASSKEEPNTQIDLLFERDDRVMTLCEIKYLKTKVTKKVIEEFERKCELFKNKKNQTIHRVLISATGADDSLINEYYFDDIITLDDLIHA